MSSAAVRWCVPMLINGAFRELPWSASRLALYTIDAYGSVRYPSCTAELPVRNLLGRKEGVLALGERGRCPMGAVHRAHNSQP